MSIMLLIIHVNAIYRLYVIRSDCHILINNIELIFLSLYIESKSLIFIVSRYVVWFM